MAAIGAQAQQHVVPILTSLERWLKPWDDRSAAIVAFPYRLTNADGTSDLRAALRRADDRRRQVSFALPPPDLTSVGPPAAVAQIFNNPAARVRTTLSVRPSTCLRSRPSNAYGPGRFRTPPSRTTSSVATPSWQRSRRPLTAMLSGPAAGTEQRWPSTTSTATPQACPRLKNFPHHSPS
jgi:hypothetical protein